MRKFTRVLCLCLMLALIFSLGMPAAFAEGTEPEEVAEPVPTPTPEVPEPTSTPVPEVPSPYVDPKFPCLHISREYIVDEASTCSKTGSGHWVCKNCGATDTYSIPKNLFAHNASATNIVSGSFVDESHTVKCSDCGMMWSKLHSRVIDSEKPATCLEDGHSAGVYCADGCGYDTRIVYSAPGEHSWGEWTVKTPATCTEDGLEIRECSKCPATEERAIKAAGEHSWGEWTVKTAATCTEDGLEIRECSKCPATEERAIKAAGEHSWGEWTVKTPATCTKDGLEIRKCSKCLATEERTIKAAHSWGEWTVKTPATCTKDGLEIRKCSKCTATEEWTIAAEGHKPVAISDRAPTCTEPGSVGGKRCSVCKAVLEEPEVVPATGHDWGLWADTKDGWRHVRFCANDPSHKQYGFHKMGNWVTVKQNTETTDGYRERWCQEADCDYHEVQVIRAGAPKTGDSSNILFYSGLCLASLCAASGLIVFAKRRKEQ